MAAVSVHRERAMQRIGFRGALSGERLRFAAPPVKSAQLCTVLQPNAQEADRILPHSSLSGEMFTGR